MAKAKKQSSVAIVDEFDVGFAVEGAVEEQVDGRVSKVARIEVVIDGGMKLNTETAEVVGYTEKNVKLGEDRGELKVFVNKDLIGSTTSSGLSNHVKWVLFKDEEELAKEEALMFRDVARMVRAEEKKVMEEFKDIKVSLREEISKREEVEKAPVKAAAVTGKKRGRGRPRKEKVEA